MSPNYKVINFIFGVIFLFEVVFTSIFVSFIRSFLSVASFSFLKSSLIKSRSVCLSTFCPQVVKIITYLHPIPATFYGGQWSGQGLAGVGGGMSGGWSEQGKGGCGGYWRSG